MPISLDDIRSAAAALAGDLTVTPTIPSPRLSEQTGCRLHLKLECPHHTGSFKERGALNKLKSLSRAEAEQGVIAMSAGNHAQGVAYHATRLGIPATIVMPAQAPFTKVERTESYGARVLLHGETLSDAESFAHGIADRDNLSFVHPYDDPLIIAGQGTIALEMLNAVPELDVMVLPIGGGGLIAGSAIAAKAIKPDIELIGVEAELYPSMKQTLAGEPVSCAGATIAEGIAVKSPGHITREIIRDLVDDIVLVSEECLERAIDTLITEQKLVVEGAGAAGFAAILANPQRFHSRKVGTVLCGGNIDARILASILMRGLVRQRRMVRLRIALTDAPGAPAKVAQFLGDAGGNIVEIYHRRLFHNVPVKMADIDVVMETRDHGHVDAILAKLHEAGYPAELMDDVS